MNRPHSRAAVILVALFAALAFAAASVGAASFTGPVVALSRPLSPLATATFDCGGNTCVTMLQGPGFALPFGTVDVNEVFSYTKGTCASPLVAVVTLLTDPLTDHDGFQSVSESPPGFSLCSAADGTVISYNGMLPITNTGPSFAGDGATMAVRGNARFAMIGANLTQGSAACTAPAKAPTIPNAPPPPQLKAAC